jgi:hypothetical protein
MENMRNSFDLDGDGKERRFFTRSQWRHKGRMVNARDVDAVVRRTTVHGRLLNLFSFEQTVPDAREQDAKGFDQNGKQVRRQRVLMTRSQWKHRGRMVVADDTEAARTVTNQNDGHELHLFCLEQTCEHSADGREHGATFSDQFDQRFEGRR